MTQGGILSGAAIRKEMERGNIEVDPFEPAHINPASIDLTLGRQVCEYVDAPVLDSKCKLNFKQYEADAFTLVPGRLYLMHTVERVFTKVFVPVLDGKSSIGRLGICVHLTAGFGDPGFDGQYTLEVTSVFRVRVYAGMRFCQMRFHNLVQPADEPLLDYRDKGNYVGNSSRGPVTSMSWKQFK